MARLEGVIIRNSRVDPAIELWVLFLFVCLFDCFCSLVTSTSRVAEPSQVWEKVDFMTQIFISMISGANLRVGAGGETIHVLSQERTHFCINHCTGPTGKTILTWNPMGSIQNRFKLSQT